MLDSVLEDLRTLGLVTPNATWEKGTRGSCTDDALSNTIKKHSPAVVKRIFCGPKFLVVETTEVKWVDYTPHMVLFCRAFDEGLLGDLYEGDVQGDSSSSSS